MCTNHTVNEAEITAYFPQDVSEKILGMYYRMRYDDVLAEMRIHTLYKRAAAYVDFHITLYDHCTNRDFISYEIFANIYVKRVIKSHTELRMLMIDATRMPQPVNFHEYIRPIYDELMHRIRTTPPPMSIRYTRHLLRRLTYVEV